MKTLARFAWLAVVASALTLSNWSLFYVGRHYGLPGFLAGILSVSLDGAALVCADIALRYARLHGSSGASPRGAVIILAGLSAWLNSEHATLAREPLPAHVMFAAPPLIALTLFELHTRWERRDALKAAGRLAESLPVFGAFVWLLHPLGAYLAVWRITGARLTAKTTTELQRHGALVQRSDAGMVRGEAGELQPWDDFATVTTKAEAVRVALATLGASAGASDIAAWLRTRGWEVTPGYVRSVRSRLGNGDAAAAGPVNGAGSATASAGNDALTVADATGGEAS
jgi:hypothetical protein